MTDSFTGWIAQTLSVKHCSSHPPDCTNPSCTALPAQWQLPIISGTQFPGDASNMSSNRSSTPVDSDGGSLKPKPAPLPFKHRQNSEATAATESSFISPGDSQSVIHKNNDTGSSKMMSKSFGGGSSALLSTMITSTPPTPLSVQRYVLTGVV